MIYEVLKHLNECYNQNFDLEKAKAVDNYVSEEEFKKLRGLIWFFTLNELTEGLIDHFKVVWLEDNLFGLRNGRDLIEIDIEEVMKDNLIDKLVYNLKYYVENFNVDKKYDIEKYMKAEVNAFLEWKYKKVNEIEVLLLGENYCIISVNDLLKLLNQRKV